jgi:hypothetical protein
MEDSGHLHAPTALPRGKNLLYPLVRRLGGPQSRAGHGEEEKRFFLNIPIGNILKKKLVIMYV